MYIHTSKCACIVWIFMAMYARVWTLSYCYIKVTCPFIWNTVNEEHNMDFLNYQWKCALPIWHLLTQMKLSIQQLQVGNCSVNPSFSSEPMKLKTLPLHTTTQGTYVWRFEQWKSVVHVFCWLLCKCSLSYSLEPSSAWQSRLACGPKSFARSQRQCLEWDLRAKGEKLMYILSCHSNVNRISCPVRVQWNGSMCVCEHVCSFERVSSCTYVCLHEYAVMCELSVPMKGAHIHVAVHSCCTWTHSHASHVCVHVCIASHMCTYPERQCMHSLACSPVRTKAVQYDV